MRNIFLLVVGLLITSAVCAQRVTKVVLLGEKGIVQDMKLARSFIVMKKFPDGSYQRLNYKKKGPLESLQTYGDSSLSFFEGNYFKYNSNGNISCKGYYRQNKKDSTWYYYNDTFKVTRKEIYRAGELISTVDPDTVKIWVTKPKGPISEASFPGSNHAWSDYISKRFYDKSLGTLDDDVVSRSATGGKVIIHFTINEIGDVENIFILKSVEYILDEEALRIIRNSPAWTPAKQDGENIKVNRRQSIDFIKD